MRRALSRRGRRVAVAVIILILTLSPRPARAWNDCGHMVCGCVAYSDLKPEVRQRLGQLLRQHPRYQKDLLRDMPEGFTDPDLYAFMKAATWPDMVRDIQNPMHATHNHPTWHYIDFPLVAPSDAGKLHPPPLQIEGGEVDNILKALAKVSADLRDPGVSPPDKAIAVCWLSHLIGDLHQPLHTTSLFSEAYPQGDKGGNLFLVRGSGGEVVNLHALWDGILGPQSSVEAVRLIAGDIVADPARGRAALGQFLSHRDFKSWADESCADSREIVYNNFKLRGAAPDGAPASQGPPAALRPPPSELLTATPATHPMTGLADRRPFPSTAPALPVSYEAVARELATRRVALAGYRLADALNGIFGETK